MTEGSPHSLEVLEWDSSFFGFPIGRLVIATPNVEEFRASIREAHDLGLRLFYAYLSAGSNCAHSTDAIITASHVIDHKTFRRDDVMQVAARGLDVPAGYAVHSYPQREPTEALVRLAKDAGRYSRFRLDQGFARQDCDRLYHEWITKSTLREMARDVIIIRDDEGGTVGFVTIADERSPSTASIPLIAVDSTHRGRGLGRTLLQAATVQAAVAGKSALTVVTQSCNSEAIVLYEKAGFRLARVEQVHHVWIGE